MGSPALPLKLPSTHNMLQIPNGQYIITNIVTPGEVFRHPIEDSRLDPKPVYLLNPGVQSFGKVCSALYTNPSGVNLTRPTIVGY